MRRNEGGFGDTVLSFPCPSRSLSDIRTCVRVPTLSPSPSAYLNDTQIDVGRGRCCSRKVHGLQMVYAREYAGSARDGVPPLRCWGTPGERKTRTPSPLQPAFTLVSIASRSGALNSTLPSICFLKEVNSCKACSINLLLCPSSTLMVASTRNVPDGSSGLQSEIVGSGASNGSSAPVPSGTVKTRTTRTMMLEQMKRWPSVRY